MIGLRNFSKVWDLDPGSMIAVTRHYPFRINQYTSNLIRFRGDSIWQQFIPDPLEVQDLSGLEDPLAEEALSPVPNVVHRYPNRVMWLVSHDCVAHCRFCTRKRRWKDPLPLDEASFEAGLWYIESHSEIKDVLLSGGDPLLLPSEHLLRIMERLRRLRHVEIIRIGTRVPVLAPEIVTQKLASSLARFHPVFLNLHFNHPWEITAESRKACETLANAGIPLGSQTVLLHKINDTAETLGELFQELLTMRVRPYYLMQMDLTAGTAHFRTPISSGLKIIHRLRNRISGLAVPHLVIDLPNGKGKIPLVPGYVRGITGNCLIIRNHQGEMCSYPLLAGEGEDLEDLLRF